MSQPVTALHSRWETIVCRLQSEVAALSPAERSWISSRLAAISFLQEEIQGCVTQSGGDALCASCPEHCCGQGKNHHCLPNLLFYLLDGEVPPADFSAPCPQLGPTGCYFPPGRRPFNCITFNCERVEERLTAAQRQRLARLETALRALYESFARRYLGGNPHGLLIGAESLGPRPFLCRWDNNPPKE